MGVTFSLTEVGRMKVLTATMTSDASGDATNSYNIGAVRVNRATIVNDGDDTPTNLWDLTVTDDDGIDILGAAGANVAVAADYTLQTKMDVSPVVAEGGYMLVNGNLTFTGANMGNAKIATVKIYAETVR